MSLEEYFDTPESLSRADLAKRLGVTRACVIHYTKGRRTPSGHTIRLIEHHTGGAVTFADWHPSVTISTPEAPEEQVNG